ncbi:hypothetical protein G7068_05605 [Leucobacter viscericola]|uniref:DUF11 domain-containing protein n=1 Tax=Leucobacter viscericola TaxID=2714935 RepID=A0A6G7XE39_9MICO|nr:DUF11 domain-containing protein [Leucobacter viscericola]QIK62736.1 hypothetical protein G7068_05605 [Leucobacter viscericola]
MTAAYSRPKNTRFWAGVCAILVAVAGLNIGTSAAFAADPASLTVSITADTPSAQTGTNASFTIGYSCVGTVPCEGAVIKVPLPQYVDASAPSWGYNWWHTPALTNSPDVASSSVDFDGTAQFTMKASLPAGSTGSLGIRMTPTTQTTPDGATLNVQVNGSGSNLAPSTASAAMTLSAPEHTLSAQLYGSSFFYYLDQDVTFNGYIGLQDPSAVGVEGLDTLSTYKMTLPAGAQFVSAEPAASNVTGNVVTWENLPGNNNSFQPGQRSVSMKVRFPSTVFNDRQNIQILTEGAGTSVSGKPMTVSRNDSFMLETFVEKIQPYLQVSTSSYSYIDNSVARGVPYSFSLYLNNYNSTTAAANAYVAADLPAAFIFTSTYMNAGETLRWKAASGATGSYTASDSEQVTLQTLGLPEDAKLTHVEIDYGALEPVSSRSTGLNGVTTDPAVTSVQLCATATLTSASGTTYPASGCGSYKVVDPFIYASVYLQGPSGSTVYRPGDTVEWNSYIGNGSPGGKALQPVVAFVIPKGTKLADNPVKWGSSEWGCTPTAGYENPTTSVEKNAVDGQDVLTITWPGAPALEPNASLNCGLVISTVVTTAPAGQISAGLYLGDAGGPISTTPFASYVPLDSAASQWDGIVRDDRGVLPGGSANSIAFRGAATAPTGTGASLSSTLSVKGSLDTDFVTAPIVGKTEAGSDVTYRLPISNTGNVALNGVVLYDILPFVGDTGVSAAAASIPRGSQFAPVLQGAVTVPAGFSVEYSESTNPCRPEVNPTAINCVDDWTATPSDFGTVRALKFVQDTGTSLPAGEQATFDWSMQIGQDVPAAQTAFNSVAFSAVREDTGAAFVAEPTPVGVTLSVSDLAVSMTGKTGTPDSEIPLPLTVTNNGPSDSPATVKVTSTPEFPLSIDGATTRDANVPAAAAAPEWNCEAQGDDVTCTSTGPLASGSSATLPLHLTLGADGETGTVSASVTGPVPDPALDNNSTEAEFIAAEEPPIPPTDPPTTPPTNPPTNPPTVPPTGGPGASTGPGATPGTGGLSVTGGAPLWGSVIAGAVLLGVGATLVLLRRRRSSNEPSNAQD